MKRIANILVLLTLLALTFSSLGITPAYAANPNFFVSRVGRYAPSGGYTNLNSAQFVVSFSEDVNPATVTAASFAVRRGGRVTGGSITQVSVLTANSEYLVTVSGYILTGSSVDWDTLGLDVLAGTIQNMDGNPLQNGDTSGEFYYIESTPPAVNSFTAAATSSSLDIPITAFSASDDWSGVAGYLITLSATPPLATDPAWVNSVPATYHVNSEGSYTLYPWVKDSAGSISAEYGSPANVTVALNRTVTFNANGGSGTMTPQAANTSTALTLNTFTRANYNFAGWSTTPTGTVAYADGATYNFAADLTLYAQWTLLPLDVILSTTASNPTSVSPIPLTITFNQPVIGLTLGDLTVGNGTASNLVGFGVGISPLYTQVSAGGAHTCGLASGGSLQCWGYNTSGQTTVPALSSGKTYTQVSAGQQHTCGLVSDGSLQCWGYNAQGQTNVPSLSDGKTYTQVSAGGYHTCGLVSDGSVQCWGRTQDGETTVPALSDGKTYTQVSAGTYFTCSLVSDGSVQCWGNSTFDKTTVPALSGGKTYTQVSAGDSHACGLVSDGSLLCWGYDNRGQTSVPALSSGKTYTQVSAGALYTCGLVSDGSLQCWGYNYSHQTEVPALSDGKTYTHVSAGGDFTCGLVSDGSLRCWGRSDVGQTTVPLYYSVYTADLTPTTPGVVTVDLPADSAQNMAGNGNTAATQLSITYALPTHTVTFNANGGTGSMTPQVAGAPTALKNNAFARTGYTFAGWSTTPTGTVAYADGATYNFAADLTLYAKWTAVLVTKIFTSNASQDGWLLESLETSSVGGSYHNTATTFNLGDDINKKQYRSILSFSTGPTLPDNAVITAITLKVMKSAIIGGGNPVTIFGGFMVEIKNGFFGTASTLQVTDFQATATKAYGPFSPALSSNWYSFNLTAAQPYINKLATNSGLTQIRLRFKLDDNNNAIANILSLYSGNAATAAYRPQLIITYTVP
jgi:uncharacterized repeat protein (TIGR02543 family)